MKEIKVGEYARTEEGEIFRVIEQEVDFYNFQIKKLNPKEIFNPIVKHSFNIIDLIEVGDYVNGYLVRGKTTAQGGYVQVDYYMYSKQLGEGRYLTFDNDEIKSIVTKEQFENAEYKLDN